MVKSKYVLKRKGGSRKKKHVRFNLSHTKKSSRSKSLRRSSTLGVALRLRKSRSMRKLRSRGRSVAKGKYRTRGKTRSRLGGFRGGYGPGGGPIGAPWDGAEHVPGESVQGLPMANHYAYNKGGIGVGGLDPAISTRTIGGENQRGGSGLMSLLPQPIRTGIDLSTDAIMDGYTSLTMKDATNDVSSLPTNQLIDNESTIVFPNKPINLDEIRTEAGVMASSS